MKKKVHLLHPVGVTVLFFLCTFLHYPDQFGIPETFRLTSLFNLQRHALERILFILPPIWAGFSLSRTTALLLLGASLAAMAPRVLFISDFPMDAILETIISIILGLVTIVLLDTRKRELVRGEEIGRLAMLYNEEIDLSHEEERRRIARELHDDTIQRLVAVSRRLESLIFLEENLPSGINDGLEVIRTDIIDTIDGVRNCIRNIRSPVLELLGPLAAIRDFVNSAGKENAVSTEFTAEIDQALFSARFADDRGVMLYRIVQEAVRNSVRHSGTKRIRVSVVQERDTYIVEVRDFGKGIAAASDDELLKTRRLGILGMRERVRLLGGEIDIHSCGDGGTTVRIVLPTV
jgi:signal transduction histidine kinase